MILRWRDEARDDLRHIISYIADNHPAAAENLLGVIEHAAEMLVTFPYIHRAGRVAGTREAVVHPNYIIVYRVGTDHVEIVGVLHARQQYP